MNKKTTVIILLVLSILLTASCTSSSESMKYTTDQKLEDFKFVYDLLEKEYPLFRVKNRQYGVEWLDNKEEFVKRISDTKNDKEFFMELSKIISELRDGHTDILPPPFYYYIEEMLSDLVLKYPSTQNEFLVKPMGVAREDYQFWDKELRDLFEDYNKQLQTIKSSEEHVSFKEYHDGDTIYIKFSSFSISEEGCSEVLNYIKDNKDCSNIIVDIRDNGGGSDLQWIENIVYPLMNETYHIEKLLALRGGKNGDKYAEIVCGYDDSTRKKIPISEKPKELSYPPELDEDFSFLIQTSSVWEPKSPIGYGGDIYVLINDKVYSAGEGFATFCKRTGFATLVGERTRGDGGSSAPILVKLPNSGLLLRMRLQMTLNPDGTASAEYGTAPDIEVRSEDALKETLKIIASKKAS